MFTYTLTLGNVITTIQAPTPQQIIVIAESLGVDLHYSHSKKEFEVLKDLQHNHLCNIITNELDKIVGCDALYHFVNNNVYYLEFARRKNFQ